MINFNTQLNESNWDFTFDKQERFRVLLSHLYKKITGDWRVQLVNPDIKFIRELLDSNVVPEYVTLLIIVPKDTLDNLLAERPYLKIEEKTIWEYYKDMIASMSTSIESKAMQTLYKNTPHTRKALKDVLNQLEEMCADSGNVTLKDVKRVVNVRKIYYANQVIRAFMLLDSKRWMMFRTFESDLGRDKAFYTLRKYLKKLIEEKNNYMQNKEYKDKNVEDLDTYSIVYAYEQFISTESTSMLYPILLNIERRQQC